MSRQPESHSHNFENTSRARFDCGPLSSLEITYLPLASLKPAPRNARTHSRKQIGQIADSIKTFGWTNPILISDEGHIIAGHGRVAAARLLGLREVPTLRLSGLTPSQIKAYRIADNRLAELAGWDRELLVLELGELLEAPLEFELEIIGFETAEIDLLIDGKSAANPGEDEFEADTNGPAVSQLGDVWQLGHHHVICGDSLDAATYDQLMQGKQADLVLCDPPYNVKIDGHVSGLGQHQHREFAMASGEMSESRFIAFLTRVFRLLAEHSRDGAISFQFMDWRHAYEMLTAGREVYGDLKNICVWAKDNGGMGSLYRSKHELVFVFKNGTAPHVNNVELGRFGRYRTNVWEYAGMNSMHAARDEALGFHPTVKPVAMLADAILDCSNRADIVLDAFLGSGSTLLAAERTGRVCHGIEIDPLYVDVAVRRWQRKNGKEARLVGTEQTFAEVGIARSHTQTPGALEASSAAASRPRRRRKRSATAEVASEVDHGN
jgi:DNA modification methylase